MARHSQPSLPTHAAVTAKGGRKCLVRCTLRATASESEEQQRMAVHREFACGAGRSGRLRRIRGTPEWLARYTFAGDAGDEGFAVPVG
ncbi:MAG: hypothetical protein JWR32_5973 [Mycobacterium sp.]|jgi:hypothetical protein|nr:hypothetical protein [Mycobacterium sp.]